MRCKLRIFVPCFILVVLFMGMSSVSANEHKADEQDNTTVSDIIEHKAGPEYVKFTGRIIGDIGEKKYLFTDETDEIIVHIPDKHFPYPYKLSSENELEISGQLIWENIKQPVIFVDFLHVIN